MSMFTSSFTLILALNRNLMVEVDSLDQLLDPKRLVVQQILVLWLRNVIVRVMNELTLHVEDALSLRLQIHQSLHKVLHDLLNTAQELRLMHLSEAQKLLLNFE